MTNPKSGKCPSPVLAPLVCAAATLAALAMCALSCSNAGEPNRTAVSPPIVVQVDSSALVIMERLYAKRSTMNALAAKERSETYRPSAADERKTAELDALAESCAVRMSSRITGIAAKSVGGGTPSIVVLQWEAYTPEPMVLFSAYINYGSRVCSDKLPSASAALGDLADVGARMAPALLRLYPRLEYVEIHEVGPVVVANLKMTRKALGIVEETRNGFLRAGRGEIAGLGPDEHARRDAFTLELNQALVRMGKLR